MTTAGTLTGGGNACVFVTSNIATPPNNTVLIVPGVTPLVTEATDINTNAIGLHRHDQLHKLRSISRCR